MSAPGAPPPLRFRLARQIWLSRLALVWERLWPALWPAAAVTGAFLIVTLLGLWAPLPWWLHAPLLAAFAAALLAALWRARGAARLPGRAAAVRRLERESGVPHRPLSVLFDGPAGAGGEGGAEAGVEDGDGVLWRAHRRRAAALVERLRVTWPKPALAARDPWALRALLVLAVAVSAVVAGDRAGGRFAAVLVFDKSAPVPPGRLTAWIDPPEHTGLAPVFLTPPGGVAPGAPPPSDAHTVIEGSLLNARVLGGEGPPVLAVEDEAHAFEAAGEGNFTLRHAFDADALARIVQDGRDLGAWRLSVVADLPPTVALAEPPEASRRGVLRLSYAAADDFGLDSVAARIRRDGDDAWPVDLALPLAGLAPTEAEESSWHDLTAHPWAGLAVALELTAVDNAGQRGAAPGLSLRLPERPFSHPVAVEIVAQRRALALDRDSAGRVVAALDALMAAPEAFSGDVVAYLGLAAARARIAHADRASDVDRRAAIDLLWDVALRIEDGALTLAERELRAAQEALRDALDEGASPEEIAELMDRLQEALDRYLEALSESGRESEMAEERDETGFDPGELRRSRDDLQQMIESARDMAETGARDAARDMLERLQELLENMEPMRPEENPQTAGGERMLQQLQDIMEGQDELLDETFREAQRGGENESLSQEGSQTAVDRQEGLRRELGELMRQLGEAGGDIPRPLGEAERAMRDAREELARGRPDRAADAQAEALARLQEGAEMVMNEMLAGRSGERPGSDGQRREDMRDPFGRLPPGNDGDPSGFVEVPDRSAVQRSREIRDELRRRAGERVRTRTDLDYIERLLDMY